jgi:pimeloyl-ACP methyl ester carboxylesterase
MRLRWGHGTTTLAALLFTIGVASAQQQPPGEDLEGLFGPPDPEPIGLQAADNVLLKATYWEPLRVGKKVVPILLLHGWDGRRQEFDRLGGKLQAQGHAVLSLDLRGHGGSTSIKRANSINGDPIDRQRFSKDDIERMLLDVQAAKNFLIEKNNEEKLNIEQLCIVGAELGALVALNYAVLDWNRPVVGGVKTGQDVKAVVLLTPPQNFKGISYAPVLTQNVVRGEMSTLILVGSDDAGGLSDAKKLFASLARFHVKLPENTAEEEKAERLDLFLQEINSNAAGTGLLTASSKADAAIAQFVNLRLAKKSDQFLWMNRPTPPPPRRRPR